MELSGDEWSRWMDEWIGGVEEMNSGAVGERAAGGEGCGGGAAELE